MTTIEELALRGAIEVLGQASSHVLGGTRCVDGCESCNAARIIHQAEYEVRKRLADFREGDSNA